MEISYAKELIEVAKLDNITYEQAIDLNLLCYNSIQKMSKMRDELVEQANELDKQIAGLERLIKMTNATNKV